MAYIMDVLTTVAGCLYFFGLGLFVLLMDFILPLVLILLGVIAVLLVVALIRTLIRGKKASTYVPAPDKEREELCARKLSEMVKVETVSVFGESDPDKFRSLHAFIHNIFCYRKVFPIFFQSKKFWRYTFDIFYGS